VYLLIVEALPSAAVPLDSNKRTKKKRRQELDLWNPDIEDKTNLI
jgi:hypothetical protein